MISQLSEGVCVKPANPLQACWSDEESNIPVSHCAESLSSSAPLRYNSLKDDPTWTDCDCGSITCCLDNKGREQNQREKDSEGC